MTTSPAETTEARVVADLSERIHARFPTEPTELVTRHVIEALHEFDGRPIRDFVPILVERDVVDRFGRPKTH